MYWSYFSETFFIIYLSAIYAHVRSVQEMEANRVTEEEALQRLFKSGLRVREKRSILRDLERGEVTPYEIVAGLDGSLKIGKLFN